MSETNSTTTTEFDPETLDFAPVTGLSTEFINDFAGTIRKPAIIAGYPFGKVDRQGEPREKTICARLTFEPDDGREPVDQLYQVGDMTRREIADRPGKFFTVWAIGTGQEKDGRPIRVDPEDSERFEGIQLLSHPPGSLIYHLCPWGRFIGALRDLGIDTETPPDYSWLDGFRGEFLRVDIPQTRKQKALGNNPFNVLQCIRVLTDEAPTKTTATATATAMLSTPSVTTSSQSDNDLRAVIAKCLAKNGGEVLSGLVLLAVTDFTKVNPNVPKAEWFTKVTDNQWLIDNGFSIDGDVVSMG